MPDWPAPPNVAAFVTTRSGGVSAGPYATMNLGRATGDEPAAVDENRRRFAAFLPSTPALVRQVHGAGVARLGPTAAAASPPEADAAVSRDAGVPCAVLTADCLPVLFADRAGGAVGVAHAGWRGLAAGVLESAVGALRDLGVAHDDLLAWLGPAIGPRAFEVGEDVWTAFGAGDDADVARCFAPHGARKWRADLYALARLRLGRCGVAHVGGGGFCTHADGERFYSHRRQRATGRMAAVVWLADPRGPSGPADAAG